MVPSYVFIDKFNKKKHREKIKDIILIQFCDVLDSLSITMQAGSSIEKGLVSIVDEMIHLHGEQSIIVNELRYINLKGDLGITIEESLAEFAKKVSIEEIITFVDVLTIAKRSDGNIIKIISFTTKRIRENIELKREIMTSISSVTSEITVMRSMPIALIIFLRITSPGYFDVVYNSASGLVCMFLVLIVYILVIIIAEIMKNNICKIGD